MDRETEARDPEVPESWRLLRQAMTISVFAVLLWLVILHDPTAISRGGELDDRLFLARAMVEMSERQSFLFGGAIALVVMAGVWISLRSERGGFRDVLSSVSVLVLWMAITGSAVFLMATTTYGAGPGEAWLWVVWVSCFQILFLMAGAMLPDSKVRKFRERKARDEGLRAWDASADQPVIRERALQASLRNLMVSGLFAPLSWMASVHFGFWDYRTRAFSGAGGGPAMLKILDFVAAAAVPLLLSFAIASVIACVWGLRNRGLLTVGAVAVAITVKLFWSAVVAGCVFVYALLVIEADTTTSMLSGVLVLVLDAVFTLFLWAWNGLKSEIVPH